MAAAVIEQETRVALKTHDLVSHVWTVAPEQAKDWVQKNPSNRRIRQPLVERYARDMAAGAWLLSGDAIKFSKHGELLDGQHRLLACIQANRAFKTVVIFGLEEKVRLATDSGARRTFADYLKISGETDTDALAGTIRLSWLWDNGYLGDAEPGDYARNWRVVQPTHSELQQWYRQNPEIRQATRLARPLLKAPTWVLPSAAGAFVYRTRGYPDQSEFLNQLSGGLGLERTHPVYALRRWLANQRDLPGSRTTREYLAVMIKAFNLYLAGDGVHALAWRPAQERFPSLRPPD
jgi:hypothetical protein